MERKKDNKDDDDLDDSSNSGSSSSEKRSGSSYRRPIPKDDEINNFVTHHISHCPDCDTALSKIKVLEFFEEDITALVDWHNKLKLITKIHITSGQLPIITS